MMPENASLVIMRTLVNYIYKVSTSAQIIYHYSISPGSIPSIVIYIFSLWSGDDIEILTNKYTYDNHSHAIARVSQRVNK